MVCFDWKGGIGSSSRLTGAGHTVGVLVLANYGTREQLRVDGVPVGRLLAAGIGAQTPDGRVTERLPHEPVLELLASHGRLRG